MSDDKIPCTRGRLLIVDDEQSIRDIFSQIIGISLQNCRIDLAVNGAEGVDSFRTVHHKVILMDLKMPVMDGETAFHKIEELCEEENWEMPKVIFCTGFAASESLRKIVANSRKHILLKKPVKMNDLVEVLKQALKI